MNRPNLLFLTPSLPHNTGTGSAIRAGATIEALSANFNLYILHADFWGTIEWTSNTDFVRQRSTRYVRYVPPKSGELPASQILSEYFEGIHFHAIHTFKLIMARAAFTALLRSRGSLPPYAVLDLDDDECRSAARCLRLREEAGEIEEVVRERRKLSRLRIMEQLLLPHFSVICLAGRNDCDVVRRRCPGPRLAHLPNAIFPLNTTLPARASLRPLTVLFVGTLSYLPNEDAIIYFCSRILPLIRRSCLSPLRVRIVGARPSPKITQMSRLHPDVEVFADVLDVAPYYAEADVVIVPLRAGSGTRIKILEAFNFRKPVVSTAIGAEGLTVTNGEHLLIADEPKDFASACLRLMNDSNLGAQMTESAHAWLLANHSLENVKTVIDSLYEHIVMP
jgi:glycosyltransferase involved in cell wall biosynthesis